MTAWAAHAIAKRDRISQKKQTSDGVNKFVVSRPTPTSPESIRLGRGQADLHEPRHLGPKARPRRPQHIATFEGIRAREVQLAAKSRLGNTGGGALSGRGDEVRVGPLAPFPTCSIQGRLLAWTHSNASALLRLRLFQTLCYHPASLIKPRQGLEMC